MDFISDQVISLTNPIHKILGQFVNKPGKRLFYDRAPLHSRWCRWDVFLQVLSHLIAQLSVFSYAFEVLPVTFSYICWPMLCCLCIQTRLQIFQLLRQEISPSQNMWCHLSAIMYIYSRGTVVTRVLCKTPNPINSIFHYDQTHFTETFNFIC